MPAKYALCHKCKKKIPLGFGVCDACRTRRKNEFAHNDPALHGNQWGKNEGGRAYIGKHQARVNLLLTLVVHIRKSGGDPSLLFSPEEMDILQRDYSNMIKTHDARLSRTEDAAKRW